MEEFLGKKYTQVSQEYFDEFLAFLDYGYLTRKTALALKPTYILIMNDDSTYTMKSISLVITWSFTFTPGVEFTQTRPDGVKVQSIVTIEGNKLTQVQIEKCGRECTHVHEFFPDKMIATTTAKGFDKVMTRTFALVN